MSPRPLPASDLKGKAMLRFLEITLPWAVIVPDNGRAKYGVVNGRMILSRRYRKSKESANLVALAACKGQQFATGSVSVEMDVVPPDARKRDIANLLKMVCDALKGAAYADDSQIELLNIRRCAKDRENPCVTVWVSPIPGPCADSIPESDECGCDNCRRVT